MAPVELASVPSMPGTLEEALDNLEADHLRPHPYEFFLYYDI